jgi:hypothetical protein
LLTFAVNCRIGDDSNRFFEEVSDIFAGLADGGHRAVPTE